MATIEIVIRCNSAPLITYLDLLKESSKARKAFFDLGDLGFELARIETNSRSATTRELLVTFYPSDALLSFVATALAGNRDGHTIQ